MSTQVQLRRGSTSQHTTFTGANGEVTVDTTKKSLVVHDGSTPGGTPIATEALANSARARSNHTGTQAASTISDFPEAVDDRVAALLQEGSNITLTYNDVAGTLTIDAEGGGGASTVVAPQGRLTVASGIAVMLSNVLGANTTYYTPSVGNSAPIWDGTKFVMTTFAEISNLTTDATKNPAAAIANTNYDLFVWNDGGTIRLSRGPAWSVSTIGSAARGSGAGTTELTSINGFLVNANAITNGPAANRGTYVGTIRTNASGLIDVHFGGAGSGGVAGNLNIWNMYNRVLGVLKSIDSGASYPWGASAPYIRQYRGSAGNQVGAIIGIREDAVSVETKLRVDSGSVTGSYGYMGIGRNMTNGLSSTRGFAQTNSAAVQINTPSSILDEIPPLGYNFYAGIEGGDGTTNATFNADTNAYVSMKVWY